MERSGVTDLGHARARIPTSLRRVPSSPGERTVSGGHGGGETPVPIPNTAVKPVCADGTWGVAPWESRTPPEFLLTMPSLSGGIVAPQLCFGGWRRADASMGQLRHVSSAGYTFRPWPHATLLVLRVRGRRVVGRRAVDRILSDAGLHAPRRQVRVVLGVQIVLGVQVERATPRTRRVRPARRDLRVQQVLLPTGSIVRLATRSSAKIGGV
jgi:hypothetical protein